MIAAIVVGSGCSFTPPPGPGETTIDAPPSPPPSPDAPTVCVSCPPNDRAEGAIQIIGSTTVSATLDGSRDDRAASCGGGGGRDLFYELVVPTAQVVYAATLASPADRVLALYSGSCAQAGSELACANDPCAGVRGAQLARSLAAGTYCLVVDEGSASTTDEVELEVTFAGRDGSELAGNGPWSMTGNSCSGADLTDGSCEGNGGNASSKDVMFWRLVCPGSHSFTASTCTGTQYDSVVYTRNEVDELSCSDDGCGGGRGSKTSLSTMGGGLLQIVVDGFDGQCGNFTLAVTAQ